MKVTLHKRIVVSNYLALDAEREVNLPLPPFVGLRLYGIKWDDDEAEDEAAELGAGHGLSPWSLSWILVKRRVVSVSAASTGSLSIELAP